MDVCVVGCGVAGLTSALVLRGAGHDARIVAAALPFDTVSVVAGAIWSPSRLEPSDRVPAWALRSREVFAELVTDPATGVRPLTHVNYERIDPGPTWGEQTPYVTRLPADQLPDGYEVGLEIDGFGIDPPIYLRYLIDRFEAEGGSIEVRHLDSIGDVEGDVVVNCSGLGARELIGDDSMFAIRGQTVSVQDPGLERGFGDDSDPDHVTYAYPRTSEIVLGGTRTEGDENVEVDPAIGDRIRADTAVLDPRLAKQPVIAERVGLRPGRPAVRLEPERLPDGRLVVHNYGHGGAGYNMSWGCADEVAALLSGA